LLKGENESFTGEESLFVPISLDISGTKLELVEETEEPASKRIRREEE
jgi:hypothetical protein